MIEIEEMIEEMIGIGEMMIEGMIGIGEMIEIEETKTVINV